jgi:hypothetical protein
VYVGFALCFAAVHIDKRISEKKEAEEMQMTAEKEDTTTNNIL